MNSKSIQVTESIPTLIKNTHLDVSLTGWPAAVTAIALFSSSVIIYALKVTHPEVAYVGEDSYATGKAA